MMKKILKSHAFQLFLSVLVTWYIRFVYCTSRKDWIIDAEALPYTSGERNVIFAFWHGRLMMLFYMRPKSRKMNVLSSAHRDGMLMARVTRRFKQSTIFGSSSKGGGEAAKGLLRALKNGENISLTPDGPRGPNREVSPGIIRIAQLSGIPVLPIAFYATKHKQLNTWDHFMFALPFGRIIFTAAKPLLFTREETTETASLRLKHSLDAITAQAQNSL